MLQRLGQRLPLALACILLYASLADPIGWVRGGLVGDDLRGLLGVAVLVSTGVGVALLAWRPRRLWVALRRLDGVPLLHTALLALILRVGWALLNDVTQESDYRAYSDMADALLAGDYVLHTPGNRAWIVRPTGPAWFIAAHRWLLGPEDVWVQLSLALISTLQVVLVHDLVRRTSPGGVGAGLAALILAVWPEHVLYVDLLGSDVLFSGLVLLALWLVARGALIAALGGGLLLGLAHWVRSTGPLFWAALLVHLSGRPGAASRRAGVAAFLLGIAVPVSGIAYVNHRDMGIASIMPAQMGGWSLFLGAEVTGEGRSDEASVQWVSAVREGLDEAEGPIWLQVDALTRRAAWERWRARPLTVLLCALRFKLPFLWGHSAGMMRALETSRLGPWQWQVTVLAAGWHRGVLLLAALGLLARARGRRWDALSAYELAAVLTTAAHLFLHAMPRFKHMFLPLLAASAGLVLLVPPRRG